MFKASSLSVQIIQTITTLVGIIGIIFCPIEMINYFEILIGYFLLSCIGISIFYHRYLSHKSFEVDPIIKYIGICLGILAGRGSPLGWVAVHRQHHKYADKELDPHNPVINGLKIFAPATMKYGNNFNKFMIKDLLFKFYLFVNNYYNLIVLLFVIIFSIINLKLFLFLWVIPVALTAWSLNLFVYLTHMHGYRNYETNDNSTNNWFISLILWGEGWHNNHHNNPGWNNLRKKWWEIDISGMIIFLIKKR